MLNLLAVAVKKQRVSLRSWSWDFIGPRWKRISMSVKVCERMTSPQHALVDNKVTHQYSGSKRRLTSEPNCILLNKCICSRRYGWRTKHLASASHHTVKCDSALSSVSSFSSVIVPLFCLVVFKYLAEKYLQRLKQQTTEDPEVVHTSSNKIGEK